MHRVRGRKPSFKKHDLLNPTRDWLLGFTTTVVFFVISLTYITADFYIQFITPSKPPSITTQIINYDERDVLFYSKKYSDRDTQFKTLRSIQYKKPTPLENGVGTGTTTQASSSPLAEIQTTP